MNLHILKDIPDPQGQSLDGILDWVWGRIAVLAKADFTADVKNTFTSFELHEKIDHVFGPESSAAWRKFFLATLVADWACYNKPVDQADFARLKYVMTTAYSYTRVWFCRLPDGQMTPVGYSAWYPISQALYDTARNNPSAITDRGMFMPLRYVERKDISCAYAFNISVVEGLRNTMCSRRMIRALQRDGVDMPHVKLMTVTVDEAGKKFSRIAKMASVGEVTVQGEKEGLFASV